MTDELWNTGRPASPAWYFTDNDPDLVRYYDGTQWSAPLHVDDFFRLREWIKRTPAESQDGIEWRPMPARALEPS